MLYLSYINVKMPGVITIIDISFFRNLDQSSTVVYRQHLYDHLIPQYEPQLKKCIRK